MQVTRYILTFSILLFLGSAACKKKKAPRLRLLSVKELPGYPSGSGIEFFNGKFYLMGDDANQMLILDSHLAPIDSIQLYNFPEKRIPKASKTDIESATIIQINKRPALLLLGSGSVIPTRSIAWIIDLETKKKDSVRLDSFFKVLSGLRMDEINIEGMASVPKHIILSNRGNRHYPKNHLIITSADFWMQQARAPLRLVKVGYNKDTSVFNGVSGLAYSDKSDRLLLTVSTENTFNAMDDGAIGKSYLWVINSYSSFRRATAINPSFIVDLEEMDQRFKGRKIESVCIVSEDDKEMKLILASDEDKGSTALFTVVLTK